MRKFDNVNDLNISSKNNIRVSLINLRKSVQTVCLNDSIQNSDLVLCKKKKITTVNTKKIIGE